MVKRKAAHWTMALQLLQTPLADEVSCGSAISACAAASRWVEAVGLLENATVVGPADVGRVAGSSEAGTPPLAPASALASTRREAAK